MSLAGKHSLVVVEHDMSFVERWAAWSRCCTKARYSAEGDHGANDQRVIEVYLLDAAR